MMREAFTRATRTLVAGSVILLVAYDVVAVVLGGVEATISRVVLGWSIEYPVVPFGVGIVCGHLFWPQRVPSASKNDVGGGRDA